MGTANRRRFVYAAFGLTLLAGFGCAITDYGTITDNDQRTGKAAGAANPIIQTKGKAHIRETSQVSTLWPDGSDETLSFVDQRADGTAVLTTFNNYSTAAEPTFHDDLYCNTDRQGCAIMTAPDDNDDNRFDGTFNSKCSGARSLSLLLATGRYYGECGRRQAPRLGIEDKLRLINLGAFAKRFGLEGFLYTADVTSSSIVLTDPESGYSELLPLSGAFWLWRDSQSNATIVDLTDARLREVGRMYASWLERIEPPWTEVTFQYHGVPFRFELGTNARIGAARIRANVESAY